MSDKDLLDYQRLISESMYGIVKKALQVASKYGLPGDHHFYISFSTHHPGVMIADELKMEYPEEMTIVIQHQFWDLEVEDDRFSITLSFGNKQHNITIPFNAITSFSDPSVRFALQFNYLQKRIEDQEPPKSDRKKTGSKKSGKKLKADNVISLDKFRKKD